MHKTLYYGGHIFTCNLRHSTEEAMVTEDEKILYVGKYREARHLMDADTEIVHLGGRAIVAGFFDSMGALPVSHPYENPHFSTKAHLGIGVTSMCETGHLGALSISGLCHSVWQNQLPLRITALLSDTPEAPKGALATMLSSCGIRTGLGNLAFRLGPARISLTPSMLNRPSEVNQLTAFMSHLMSWGITLQLEPQDESTLEKALTLFLSVQKDTPSLALPLRVLLPFVVSEHVIYLLGKCRAAVLLPCALIEDNDISPTFLLYLEKLERAGLYPSFCGFGRASATLTPMALLSGLLLAYQKENPGAHLPLCPCLNYLSLNAAYAAGIAEETGSLEWGKLADFSLLSKSPLDVPPEQMADIVPLRVVIGGKVAHEYTSYDHTHNPQPSTQSPFHAQ